MSVSYGAARLTHMTSNPERDWWIKKTCQVYARLGSDADAQIIYLPRGAKDEPAPFDPSGRTYRQVTKAGELWCPVPGCEPFGTISQGAARRAHFVHEKQPDPEIHRGGPESIWHQQAKLAIHDWLAGMHPPVLELEYQHLPRLRDGRQRKPDVYVEFENGARVAFECQQQSMAGTDPADYRAQWQNRVDDYRELRDAIGLGVVWLVSPWATTANTKYIDNGAWQVEVFGSYAASMINAGETVYWIDPTFSQIGTLVQRISSKREPDLPRGYLQRTTTVVDGQWSWLHSDDIVKCEIDPITGVVTTPTDSKVQDDQAIADLHARLRADRERARIEQEEQRRAEAQARQRAIDEERERSRQEREKVIAEQRRQQAENAERARKIAEVREQERQRQLDRWISWGIGAAAGLILLIVFITVVV